MNEPSRHPPLVAEDLLGRLPERFRPPRLEVHPRLDSTNDELRRLARDGAPDGTVVIAEEQTAGRGRRGHSWHSARGLGLYLSLLLRPRQPAGIAPRYTVATAVAACRACRDLGAGTVEIKWPNDLVDRARKLAGALIELRTGQGMRIEEMVIGIGFNVHHDRADFPPDIARRSTSLRLLLPGAPPARAELAARYLVRLDEQLRQLAAGCWRDVAESWHRLSPGARGARVRVLASTRFVGTTAGLADSGALQVRRDDGRVVEVLDGDTLMPEEGDHAAGR